MVTAEQISVAYPRAGLLISRVTVLFVVAACISIVLRLFKIYLGDDAYPYLHGDWLINRELTEVRRSHIGSWILELSDLLAVSPLTVLFVLQAVLTVVLFALLVRVFVDLAQPLVLAVFVFSPALFVIFWLPYINAALRKEMIAYIAILLALSACMKTSAPRLVFSAVILVAGVYGHEANVLFVPVFMLVLWICKDSLPARRAVWISLAVVTAGALHAFWYAFAHRQLTDIALVCDPLTGRGIDASVCVGSIRWLTDDLRFSLEAVQSDYGNWTSFRTMGTIYALTFIPVFYALSHLRNRRHVIALALLATLPFFPLYVVALDWGRWVSIQLFCMMAVVMATLHSGYSGVVRQPGPIPVVLIMLGSFLWVPYVLVDINWLWYEKVFSDILEIIN